MIFEGLAKRILASLAPKEEIPKEIISANHKRLSDMIDQIHADKKRKIVGFKYFNSPKSVG